MVIHIKGKKFIFEDYHRTIDGIFHKRCAHHEEIFGEEIWLPCTSEYFYPNDKNKTIGLNPECKECTKNKSTNWRKENPESYKISMRKTDSKEHRVKHHKENSKRQRESGQVIEWQNNNRDKIAQYTTQRNKNKIHNISDIKWEICKEYFYHECAYCGLHIDNHFKKYAGIYRKQDFHREHVDDDGSNEIENCVPSCHLCNSSKNTREFEDWYSPDGFRRGSEVYSVERYNRIIKWLAADYKITGK